ncbi:MAG: M48 family metallopeptidase [Verrucomicrobiae bacterium]|nr:M48 family metallopeptidase [Verrucomicrobiae bacterium]
MSDTPRSTVPVSEPATPVGMTEQRRARAKQYERIHNWLYLGDIILTLGILVVLLWTGASATIAQWARTVVSNPWLHVPLYVTVLVIGLKLVFLPLSYVVDYRLEHRFGLSTETLAGWLKDQAKSLALNLGLGVVVVDIVYFLLRQLGEWWWLAAGTFLLVFGVVLSALYPVAILPWFYKLTPVEDESLRAKLTALAQQVNVRLLGIYRMQLSDKTRKANAAFAGLGRTRRILLGDTLLDRFAPDEIEVVLAHEIAHYKHRDVSRLLAWNALTIFGGLWVTEQILTRALAWFGFADRADIGALPLLALCLVVFGLVVMPLNNAFSRWREWEADRAALAMTGNADAMVRALEKLADQNLADPEPHPWIEFLLHDHPSLGRRIAFAKRWAGA